TIPLARSGRSVGEPKRLTPVGSTAGRCPHLGKSDSTDVGGDRFTGRLQRRPAAATASASPPATDRCGGILGRRFGQPAGDQRGNERQDDERDQEREATHGSSAPSVH